MTAMATLRALACGTGRENSLLHSCRLGGFGGEAYGVDAIVERFSCNPMALTAASESIEVAGHIAIFDSGWALLADVDAGRIARLWRIGAGTPACPEPRIDVPFDPCLAQAGSDVAFAACDHPALTPAAGGRVLAIGSNIMQDRAGGAVANRVCVFVLRAFGDADAGAALFAVHRTRTGTVRTAGFANIGVLWRGELLLRVDDTVGEAAIAAATWSPVVAETIDPPSHKLDMPS